MGGVAADFGAVILLPERPMSEKLEDLVKYMTAESWQDLSQNFRREKVSLGLPRFKLDYGPTSLKHTLTDIGFKRTWDVGNRFGRITKEELGLSDVLTRAVCDVNEDGTVSGSASAAFRAQASPAVGSKAAGIEVWCDRPFAFAIVHMASFAPLFIGRVSIPDEQRGRGGTT